MRLIVKSFQAKDLPAVDEDATNVFSKSELILLDHATKRFMNTSELKELIQEVLYHPDFDIDSVDHYLHERLMHAVEGDIEIIDMQEEHRNTAGRVAVAGIAVYFCAKWARTPVELLHVMILLPTYDIIVLDMIS